MRRFALHVLAGLVSLAAGQTPSEFEVVSVKAVPPPMHGISSRESVDGALLTYTDFTLQRMISNAYGVTERQILGPAWISEDLFEMHARLPSGTGRAEVPAMLRKMLSDRFQLAVER